ncbi:MAG: hypothetical protein RLZZ219_1259 [Cyanobacteriota bacterium]
MTLLVVDDHQLVGQAVGGLLAEQCGLTLQGVCTSAAEAIAFIEHNPPGLMLLDQELPGVVVVAEALLGCNPQARLILLASSAASTVHASIRPALLGIVQRSQAWEHLVGLVRAWERPVAPAPRGGSVPSPAALEQLSPRERRVFKALGLGLPNKRIAQRLGLSLSTVESYRKIVSAKLALSGAELVRAAVLHRCVGGIPGVGPDGEREPWFVAEESPGGSVCPPASPPDADTSPAR